MNVLLPEIIEESIKLELNVSRLYDFFSVIFPEDADLWQLLSNEEKNHASLLKTSKDVLLSCVEFPDEVLAPTLVELNTTNDHIISLLKEFNDNPPSRESALNSAISLEESAGEMHFQQGMDKRPTPNNFLKIFQDLNKYDMDHAKRIREYKNSLGI